MSNKIHLSAPGMMCGACANTIETALKNSELKIVSLNIDLPEKTLQVDTDFSVSAVIQVLKSAGFDATEI